MRNNIFWPPICRKETGSNIECLLLWPPSPFRMMRRFSQLRGQPLLAPGFVAFSPRSSLKWNKSATEAWHHIISGGPTTTVLRSSGVNLRRVYSPTLCNCLVSLVLRFAAAVVAAAGCCVGVPDPGTDRQIVNQTCYSWILPDRELASYVRLTLRDSRGE